MDKYTHIAELYGYRCYFNEHTNEVEGTNWLNDKMIAVCSWLDETFGINDGFYLKVIERLDKK